MEEHGAQEPNPHKGRFGLARPYMAALNTLRGLKFAWREEEAFRQEVAIAIPLITLAFFLPVTAIETVLLILPLGLLLIVELMNTAIEATVDRISMDRHPLSGKAKDLGSAAVGFCIVLAIIDWLVILWPLWQKFRASG
jgi:diacylglycerol kinase (ATP)